MKKKFLFPLMLLGCWLFFPQTTMAQYPPDYASAYYSGVMPQHPTVIRKVDASSALVSYYDDNLRRSVISLIDLSMNRKCAVLEKDHTVYDMRITGDNVYFCGTVYDGAKAFIGHVSITGLISSTPTIYYYYLDQYSSVLKRLVAYDIDGKQKVVAVGTHHFINNGAFTCPYDSVHHPYTCKCYFVVEGDFTNYNLLPPYFQYLATNDTNHNEDITEVIETPNYVALVGHYYEVNSPVIHPCQKGNVLGSFPNNGHYYPAVPNEGHSDYHGCVMNGDTIAVASLSSYFDGMGMVQFSTNVRVFDLASMTNTEAQMVPLNTKSEPYDLVYMPDKGRLVLLQDICLPPHPCDQNMFMHLEPYAAAPYAAKCWYESHWNKPFYSLERLSGDYYLAAGGQYWCMKELMNINSGGCYIPDNINVQALNTLPFITFTHSYINKTPNISKSPAYIYVGGSIRQECF